MRLASLRRRAVPLALALLALAVPLLDRNAAHVDFLTNAGVFILLALGLNVVVGFAGLLDLGYAAFFAIGSYSYALLASGQLGPSGIHVPFWVMLFFAAAIAGLFGVLLGAPTLRLRGDYLAIVTLGFGEIVPQVFLNADRFTNGPNGIGGLDEPVLFGLRFGIDPTPYYYVVLVLIALAVVVATNLRESRLGRAWMAIREDELAAKHMGIDTTAAKLSAFAIGAAFSGVAGVVSAAKLGDVSPESFKFNVSVLVLSMLVLGGMGSIPGVILGSFVLSAINYFVLPQAGPIAQSLFHVTIDFTEYRFFIYGAVLVLMMLFRPEGFLPSRRRRSELRVALADETLARHENAEYGA